MVCATLLPLVAAGWAALAVLAFCSGACRAERRSPLGTNLAGVADWTTGAPFASFRFLLPLPPPPLRPLRCCRHPATLTCTGLPPSLPHRRVSFRGPLQDGSALVRRKRHALGGRRPPAAARLAGQRAGPGPRPVCAHRPVCRQGTAGSSSCLPAATAAKLLLGLACSACFCMPGGSAPELAPLMPLVSFPQARPPTPACRGSASPCCTLAAAQWSTATCRWAAATSPAAACMQRRGRRCAAARLHGAAWVLPAGAACWRAACIQQGPGLPAPPLLVPARCWTASLGGTRSS